MTDGLQLPRLRTCSSNAVDYYEQLLHVDWQHSLTVGGLPHWDTLAFSSLDALVPARVDCWPVVPEADVAGHYWAALLPLARTECLEPAGT